MANKNLTNAKRAKNDEFYTQFGDIQKKIDDYYKAVGTGAYKEGNPTAGWYENDLAKMVYKRIFIKHKKKII